MLTKEVLGPGFGIAAAVKQKIDQIFMIKETRLNRYSSQTLHQDKLLKFSLR